MWIVKSHISLLPAPTPLYSKAPALKFTVSVTLEYADRQYLCVKKFHPFMKMLFLSLSLHHQQQ